MRNLRLPTTVQSRRNYPREIVGNIVKPRKNFRVEAITLQKIARVVEESRPESSWRVSVLNCLTRAARLMLEDSFESTEDE
jgi:hypothetical protein